MEDRIKCFELVIYATAPACALCAKYSRNSESTIKFLGFFLLWRKVIKRVTSSARRCSIKKKRNNLELLLAEIWPPDLLLPLCCVCFLRCELPCYGSQKHCSGFGCLYLGDSIDNIILEHKNDKREK